MRILLLTSSTGGGHDMRAKAYQAWAKENTSWEVEIHQTLESTHALYKLGVGIYNRIQRTFPALHHIYFNYLEAMSMHKKSSRILGGSKFRSFVSDYQPELVLSTHAHLNHGFFELARQSVPTNPPRCVTYCGELFGGYGFSKHWVNPDADLFIGAVDETTQAARELGAHAQKARTGGFLLQPSFYKTAFTTEQKHSFLSENLGLDPKLFTLLLCTGAVGANNHLPFLKCLEERAQPIQVIALCGTNKKTLTQIELWKKIAKHITVKTLPYSSEMPLLLQSVDAAVARPGTGTFSEAIISECPLIMNGIGGIMPQERITQKYAAKHQIDFLINRPEQLGEILNDWRANGEILPSIRKKLIALRPQKSPLDILRMTSEREF